MHVNWKSTRISSIKFLLITISLMSACKEKTVATAKSKGMSKNVTLADFPKQTCYVVSEKQRDGSTASAFVWNFSNDAEMKELEINISTDTLPASGSNFDFSKSTGYEQRIGFSQYNGESYASGGEPGDCTMSVITSKVDDQPIESLFKGYKQYLFQISAKIKCRLVTAASTSTMEFNVEPTCEKGSLRIPI